MTDEVILHLNTETGTQMYSICPIDDPEYWIESFPTYEEAREFCDDNGYEIVEETWKK